MKIRVHPARFDRRLRWLALAALLLASAARAAPSLDLAWWKDGALHAQQLQADGSLAAAGFDGKRRVPLGSLWKLFVYTYAVDTNTPMPDYVCGGRNPDEAYCCEPGHGIGRDAALAQSCGLFFEPARLGIGAKPWREYWARQFGRAPDPEFDWLADPAHLKPERMVSLRSLLRALAAVPAASRETAESALLNVVLGSRGAETVSWFGSRLRVKTFSWHQEGHPDRRLGGAAGWLADGTPVWFAGAGTSSAVLQRWAPLLAGALPAADGGDAGCVLVDYFARYPIRGIEPMGPARQAVAAGPLSGRYRIRFENGNFIKFSSQGELALTFDPSEPQRPLIRGRLGINEYVARVLQREADASQPEAAKALAIAARTYLQQNAVLEEGCQRIADSSSTQRVSPNPAGAAVRAIARWTDQLILSGVDARYHRDRASANTLVWREAQAQARAGKRFDEILRDAFPGAELVTLANSSGIRCERLLTAQAWLEHELPLWERSLNGTQGYERPAQLPAICMLNGGAPYSEQGRNRIFVRGLASRDDRITLAHEYLHLGFRNHPRGQDEEFVEQLAQRLVAGLNPMPNPHDLAVRP